jgi:uroporphyrinogen decarboxylase
MSATTLTSRERVLKAIDHQETDRVPVQIYLTPEIHKSLVDALGRPPVEAFQIDLRTVAARRTKPLKQPEPGSEVQYYDEFGVGYASVPNNAGGEYMEAVDLTLARIETMDDVRAYDWPSPDDYDYSKIPEQIRAHEGFCVCVGHAGQPDIINSVGRGRGMEQVLCDIALEDEVGMTIIQKRVDFFYEISRRSLEVGEGKIDILWLGEDLGTQKGLTVSPAMFDKVFRPAIQRFIDLGHDFGCKVAMHSCGSTRQLQPTLIEMGLDVLDAVQPEPVGMDPEELKREHGDQLTYCGLISTQQTLPHGSVEDCREEARHRIRVMGEGGGYIFSPAHCIQPDTPVENVFAIYEEALGVSFP